MSWEYLMSDVWFTADFHIDHYNIMKYCNRQFQSVKQMNEKILDEFNKYVKSDDKVYFLGDLAFGDEAFEETLIKMNGDITFIRGNHDFNYTSIIRKYCKEVYDLRIINVNGRKIVLCHYPLRSWDGQRHYSWQLHGHCHGTLNPLPYQYDVGVDKNNMKPVSLKQLNKIMNWNYYKKNNGLVSVDGSFMV